MKTKLTLFFLCSATLFVGCDKSRLVKEGELSEEDRKKLEEMSTQVSVQDFMRQEDELINCKASLKAKESSIEMSLKAEYAKGETVCREAADKDIADAERRIKADAEALLKDVKERLSVYSYKFAIVNGLCVAKMSDGRHYEYRMRNVCASVVNKVVGSGGELVGISKAVSSSAMREGILDFECSIGKANIKFIENPCVDVAADSSVTDVSKVKK